jgi:hypothetical protein
MYATPCGMQMALEWLRSEPVTRSLAQVSPLPRCVSALAIFKERSLRRE